ncbi:ParB family chromosome partitioning protein [Kineosphaera limosa]|uniref:Chromosome partitioning protein ParB n=1 Tax=Kineosphaera limosa NBRC 100340 TaxID=1184609 RepID=K6W8A1_9MICO|nr:ParB/RepB/Spo0J family partition protein [Kineosphaera limosa]NYE01035.1 ParB family chromosome partitioning protein [Kineosphaera limosa]GAB95420.1 chromosome partitioning protein ParB [Kineosphaera limosa NBRC 100340]
MSERRRGLGRGLGALIPTEGSTSTVSRPRDVFFRDRDEEPSSGSIFRPSLGQYPTDSAGGIVSAPAVESPAAPSPAVESAAAAEPPTQEPAGEGDSTADADIVPVPGATFALLPLDDIRPNPRQPREIFDEDELKELVHSITEIGVLQPVVVRPVPQADRTADGPAYELVMGERRWRASREAGQPTIPAIIRSTDDDAMLRDALLENLHRTQLNPLEEAAAYQQLLEDFGCTHEELAGRIGRSRPQISNIIRLLKLPPLVQRRVAAGVLSAGHARALLALPDAGAMERLAQRIVAEGLSVRSVEEIVALGGEPERPSRRPRSDNRLPELDDLAAFLADRWETRVSIAMGRRKGRLTVEFASVDDLNRILEAIGEQPVDSTHEANALAG